MYATKAAHKMSYSSPSKRICIGSIKTIDELNDHILREVFKHLSVIDLCAVADVCSIFKRNAKTEISLRFRTKGFETYVGNYSSGDCDKRGIRLRQLPSILRHFGPVLKSFEIGLESSHKHYSQAVMELINHYCSETLNELTLDGFEFAADFVLKLRPLLSQLQLLKFSDCCWKLNLDVPDSLVVCSKLEKLFITFCYDFFPFRVHFTFPKLKSVTFGKLDIGNKAIENVLAVSPQLNELNITPGCYNGANKEIQLIVQHTPKIKKIDLRVKPNDAAHTRYIEDVKYLKQLTALNSLRINCQFHQFSSIISEIAAAEIPLEYLRLDNCHADIQLAHGIAALRQLKELEFHRTKKMLLSHILIIFRNLSELTQLYINTPDLTLSSTNLCEIIRSSGPKLRKLGFALLSGYKLSLDMTIYNQILDVFGKRTEKCRFDLILWPHWPNSSIVIDLPNEIIKSNEETFKITVGKY